VIGADGFSYVTPQPGAVESVAATGRVAEDARNMRLARIHSLGAVTLGDDVEIGAGDDHRRRHADRHAHRLRHQDRQSRADRPQRADRIDLPDLRADRRRRQRVIGDRVVLGGQTGVADHVTIGSDVVIGARSASPPTRRTARCCSGRRRLPRDEALAIMLAWRRLPRLVETVERSRNGFPRWNRTARSGETASEAGMSDDVADKIIAIIAEQAMLDPSEVTLDASPEALGLDSLGMVEIVFAIEERSTSRCRSTPTSPTSPISTSPRSARSSPP
jgi:hypothetical protein